jgi:hypothetical protein
MHSKVSRFLSGGISHPDVSLAVWLGLMTGFVLGYNLTLAAVLLAALILNVNTRLFLGSAMLGGMLGWGLAPLTLRVGRFVLDDWPLGRLFGALGDDLWLVLLDWDRYTLAGGVVLSGLCGIPLARFIGNRVQALRRRAEEMEPGQSFGRFSHGSPLTRLLSGMLLSRDAAANLDRLHGAPRLFRPGGWAVALLLTTVTATTAWYAGSDLLGWRVLNQLALLNAAEVNASEVNLSLSEGRLEIIDLQVANPADLARDRLRVGRVVARLNPAVLLRGRLEVEFLELSEVRGDIARTHVAQRLRPLMTDDGDPPQTATTSDTPREGWIRLPLEQHVQRWDEKAPQLTQAGRLIETLETLSSQLIPWQDDASRSNVIVSRGALRSRLGRNDPILAIDHLRADRLSHQWGLGRRAIVRMHHLTSDPSRGKQPTEIEIMAPATSTEVTARLNPHNPEAKNQLEFHCYDVALAECLIARSSHHGLTTHSGTATIHGRGTFDSRHLQCDVTFEVNDLEAHFQSQEPVGGITAGTWNQALRALPRFGFHAILAGSWQSPYLEFEEADATQQLKHQLHVAGEHLLVASIEGQLVQTARADAAMGHPHSNGAQESVAALASSGDDPPGRVTRGESPRAYGQLRNPPPAENPDGGVAPPKAEVARRPDMPLRQSMTSPQNVTAMPRDTSGQPAAYAPPTNSALPPNSLDPNSHTTSSGDVAATDTPATSPVEPHSEDMRPPATETSRATGRLTPSPTPSAPRDPQQTPQVSDPIVAQQQSDSLPGLNDMRIGYDPLIVPGLRHTSRPPTRQGGASAPASHPTAVPSEPSSANRALLGPSGFSDPMEASSRPVSAENARRKSGPSDDSRSDHIGAPRQNPLRGWRSGSRQGSHDPTTLMDLLAARKAKSHSGDTRPSTPATSSLGSDPSNGNEGGRGVASRKAANGRAANGRTASPTNSAVDPFLAARNPEVLSGSSAADTSEEIPRQAKWYERLWR